MKKYQVHKILVEVEYDENGDVIDTDILEEDEVQGAETEFDSYDEARTLYDRI